MRDFNISGVQLTLFFSPFGSYLFAALLFAFNFAPVSLEITLVVLLLVKAIFMMFYICYKGLGFLNTAVLDVVRITDDCRL